MDIKTRTRPNRPEADILGIGRGLFFGQPQRSNLTLDLKSVPSMGNVERGQHCCDVSLLGLAGTGQRE